MEVSFIGGGNHSTRRPVASHWQTLSHNVESKTSRHDRDSNSQLVVISTDCIGSCKFNYHTITTVPGVWYYELTFIIAYTFLLIGFYFIHEFFFFFQKRPNSRVSSAGSRLPVLTQEQKNRLTKLMRPKPLPKEVLYSKWFIIKTITKWKNRYNCYLQQIKLIFNNDHK